MNRRLFPCTAVVPVLVALWIGSPAAVSAQVRAAQVQGALLVDGDFESDASSKQLRAKETTQGWYESRQDGKTGPKLLLLSKKPYAGNKTNKAKIKGSVKFNTYLTQAFSQPQKSRLALRWDICVKEILGAQNRSAFQMIGTAAGGKGPNSTGAQRYVFLGFENAGAPGKINLFAFEGGSAENASKRTMVASNLNLKKWYTIAVDVNVPGKSYTVTVSAKSNAAAAVAVVTAKPVQLRAFDPTGKGAPAELTHISFASWNDGPGTFYVDNVR